jgi:hypothetical protein
MLVGENELKVAIAANVALTKAGKKSELWEEGAKLYCQVTMHKIPSFPENKESKYTVHDRICL